MPDSTNRVQVFAQFTTPSRYKNGVTEHEQMVLDIHAMLTKYYHPTGGFTLYRYEHNRVYIRRWQ